MFFSVFKICINGIMWCIPVMIVLTCTALYVKDIYVIFQVAVVCSFSLLYNFLLSFHWKIDNASLVCDTHLGCFQFKANINETVMSILICIFCVHMHLCLWYKLETKPLGHRICLCSIWENTKQFSKCILPYLSC